MTNKKFFVGMAVLLSVSLFVIGCETEAADGGTGPRGDNVGIITAAAVVDGDDLEAAFLAADVVTLGPKVTSVSGTVKGGKRLVVSGILPVTIGEELVVEGSVEVAKGAALAGVGGTASGTIKGAADSVYGQGTLALPYEAAAGYLSYSNASFAGTKAVGGLSAANVATFFADPDNSAVTALTVYDLPAITAAAVPATGKTLTLAGEGNTVTGPLDLTGKGTLVVAEGAMLKATTGITITGAEVGDPAKPNFVVNGTLKLASTAVALTLAGKVDLANATIDATEAGVATLTLPAGAAAVAAIKVGATNDLSIAGATGLTVTAIASSGKGVKSASVTAYTTSTGNSISPTAGALATVIISKIDNNEVTVETGTAAAQIDNIAGSAIKVKINGASGVIIPGVGEGKLLLTTANLAKFVAGTGNKITVTGAATGTAGTLEIPDDLEVVAATATLATITGLTVGDRAILTLSANATLAGLTGGIVIGEEAYLDVGAGTALSVSGKSLSTAEGGIIKTSAIGGLTKLATLTHIGTVNIGIEGVNFTADYAVPNNVILVILGTTAVSGAAAITVSGGTGSRIYVPNGGTLTLTGGAASGSTVGTLVSVTAPVTVAAGGTLSATAGAGGTSVAGGAVTIGVTGEGAKVSFVKGNDTIVVGLTSGAAADSGAGGAVTLFTDNAIKSISYSGDADAIIDGVTLTITGGVKDGGGSDGIETINDSLKSIVVAGGTHG
jgi:hypothetical protein